MTVLAQVAADILDDDELGLFQDIFKRKIGLHLTREKKALVVSRLNRRLADLRVTSFRDYHRIISATGPSGAAELQQAIDLITTNETRFFREAGHFSFLRDTLTAMPGGQGRPVRAWSAACSSGEEAFSMAMVMDEVLGAQAWQLVGSDISQSMLQRARRALYPLARCRNIPTAYLKRHCLRGEHEFEGQLLVDRRLRERLTFGRLNLIALPDGLGLFDVIFLCNVLIYFDSRTRLAVIESVLRCLRPGGYLMLGMAESLHGVATPMEHVAPAVYRKPQDGKHAKGELMV